jgi:hypothetical protein
MSSELEKRFVSSVIEASELLREIAGPLRIGDGVKAMLVRAHRRLAGDGFSFNRVRDIYHRDPRIKISADELTKLRAARSEQLEKEARYDARELLARIERLEAMLARREDADG